MSARGSGSIHSVTSVVSNTERVTSLLKKRPIERKLRKTYFKLEDAYQKYQPIIHETEYWPKIDLDTPHGYCPFICSTEEHKERLQLYEDLQHDNRNVKKTPKGEKTRIRRNITYCECCKMNILNLDEHLQSKEHKSYVTNEENYKEVREIMQEMNKTGASLLEQYFLQQKKLKQEAANHLNADDLSYTNKENIPEKPSQTETLKQGASCARISLSPKPSCSTWEAKENLPVQELDCPEKQVQVASSVASLHPILTDSSNRSSMENGSNVSGSIGLNFSRSTSVEIGSNLLTASVIYNSSNPCVDAEMQEEKLRRLSHVEKLKPKTSADSSDFYFHVEGVEENYLSVDMQPENFIGNSSKDPSKPGSNMQSSADVPHEKHNYGEISCTVEKPKSATPPFKKVCAKLFKSPAPYEFSLENFGIKLTPSPNIACMSALARNVSVPAADSEDSCKFYDPSPEIFPKCIQPVSQRSPEFLLSSQSDFRRTLKDTPMEVEDSQFVIINDKVNSPVTVVTPPRSKRMFDDVTVLSNEKKSVSVQMKRLKLENVETTVVDEEVTFFTPRSVFIECDYSRSPATKLNSSGTQSEFNSKCTTPSMFTGVSSPLTLLGKSSDLEVNGEALDGNQSDELPASPVIGSTNRKCSNSVPSVDCRECPYMEGFCPLPAEVEMIDVPIADVADGRVGSKRKKSKRTKPKHDEECEETVLRRTSRVRTARGHSNSSCSQGDDYVAAAFSSESVICVSTPGRSRHPVLKVLHTPTPNLDSAAMPPSQQSTLKLKETLRMKRVRKICRKLHSSAKDSDVKHFDHLISKFVANRLV